LQKTIRAGLRVINPLILPDWLALFLHLAAVRGDRKMQINIVNAEYGSRPREIIRLDEALYRLPAVRAPATCADIDGIVW